MRRTHVYLPQTSDAVALLGAAIAAGRRRRRMTAAELAERAGITVVTLRKIERGEPTVAIGTVFEAAALVGVPLFGLEPGDLRAAVGRERDRLAVLPARIRTAAPPDDDF